MTAVCVFCGSRTGSEVAFRNTASQLGEFLGQRRHTLVYGGGSAGLMGSVANGSLRVGGTVIGVIPDSLATVELMHAKVADMRVVPDMHARKAEMHRVSDKYVALPGGFGTMEELFEVLSWAQLEIHQCPIALFNQFGIFDGVLQLIGDMVEKEFLPELARELLFVTGSFRDLCDWIEK